MPIGGVIMGGILNSVLFGMPGSGDLGNDPAFFYTLATQTLTVPNLSTTLITPLTSGSVPVIGTTGALSQDADDLWYNLTTHRFIVGSPTAAGRLGQSARITVWGDDTTDDIFSLLSQPAGARSNLSSVNGWQINSLGLAYHFAFNGSTEGLELQEDATAGREAFPLLKLAGNVASRTVPLAILRSGTTPTATAHALSVRTFLEAELAHIAADGGIFGASYDLQTAGALNIGTSIATSIVLGSSVPAAMLTTINGGLTLTGTRNGGASQGVLAASAFDTASISITSGVLIESVNHQIAYNAGSLFATGHVFKLNNVTTFEINGPAAGTLVVKTTAARQLDAQGSDVVSAADLVLPGNGNRFVVTAANQIDRISKTDWQDGSVVKLTFTGAPVVKNAIASAAAAIQILLAGGADLNAADKLSLILELNTVGGVQAWRQVAPVVQL